MSRLIRVTVVALFALWIPPQASRLAAQGRQGMSIQTGEACSGLTDEECCGQRLLYAGFQAQGDYLPRKVKTTVKLACMQANITTHVCRTIATTRGFASKEVDAICRPAQAKRQCGKDGTCKRCTRELGKLAYKRPHNACYAVTYRPPQRRGAKVVVLREGDADRADAVEVTRRRTVIE